MRVLLTGDRSDVGRLVKLDLLATGAAIRLFGGSITDVDAVRRQVRHVDALVHVDFLDDYASLTFPQFVDYNVSGSIHLAAAAEQQGVPMGYWTPPASGTAARTMEMAAEVLKDYHVYRAPTLDDLVEWVERYG